MRFDSCNWMDVERYLAGDNRLMLIFGACEQHGYLSLLTDAKIPQALADAASEQTGVLVAPPLNFGNSPYFLAYPGTISLRVETLLQAAEDIVRSVYRNGFRRILVLNGHGGNASVQNRLYELANEMPDLQVRWFSWWHAPVVRRIAAENDLVMSHASWLEAFPFTRVADLPDNNKPAPASKDILNAESFRDLYGDGTFGGTYQAPDGVMAQVFAACLDEIIELLQFEN